MRGHPTARQVVDGYEALFTPVARAAHLACLSHARVAHEDGWPTILSCIDFARRFEVPAAELAAFFGYLSWAEGRRSTWADALNNGAGSHLARQLASSEQARAFGFQCAFSELVDSGEPVTEPGERCPCVERSGQEALA